MARTGHQLQELHHDQLHRLEIDRRPPVPAQQDRWAWLTEPAAVSRRWAKGLGLAWVGVFSAAVLLEPAPPEAAAAAPEPLWSSLLFLGLFMALIGTGVGLSRGRRIGLVTGVVAAGLALAGSVMCPVSGHHPSIGAWWFLQMAGFVGLMGATLVGLRRSRTT